jgi:hypothetical protein
MTTSGPRREIFTCGPGRRDIRLGTCACECSGFCIPHLCLVNQQFKSGYEEEVFRALTVHVTINVGIFMRGPRKFDVGEQKSYLQQRLGRLAKRPRHLTVSFTANLVIPYNCFECKFYAHPL